MFEEEIAAIPVQPPRTGTLPGMRLGATTSRSTLPLLLVVVALFAAFPVLIISTDPRARLAVGPSRTTEGRVLSMKDVSGCAGTGGRRIVYAFSPEPTNEFRGGSVVCDTSPYYSAQAGDKVQIRYLRRDPVNNAIVGATNPGAPLFVFMIFPVFALLIFVPLYLPQVREAIRARRLYATGVLAKGKVVFVKKRGPNAWSGLAAMGTSDVYVAHQLPGVERAETIVSCANDWLINQLSPGTTVHILLPREKAAKGILLEAFLR